MSEKANIEKITEAEAAIEQLTTEEEALRAEAMADGEIDATEQEALDTLKDKIDQLRETVAALRKALEENKAIWEGKAAQYEELDEKFGKLTDFGHAGMEVAARAIADIQEAVAQQRWADATARLDTGLAEIADHWAAYEVQAKAKESYTPKWTAFEKRRTAAKAVDATTEEARAALEALELKTADLMAAEAARDYVKALEEMKAAMKALLAAEATLSIDPPANLSGKAWFDANEAKYPNSDSIADLDSSFKSKVQDFEAALVAAGVNIDVESTRRHVKRAAIMHWSYMVAKKQVSPSAVPVIDGVDINFDHGDDAISIAKALEMTSKQCFGIKFKPSLTSIHIDGKAIDWALSWSGELKIKNKSGEEVTISSSPTNGTNTELHPVGESYGVVKLVGDEPHWSIDGS